jgi:hypothetical protein
MRIRLLASALAALLPLPAGADLVMSGRSSVAAIGLPSIGQERLMLKANQVRRDLIDRGRAYSYLIDLDKRQVSVLDHALRSAEVFTLGGARRAKLAGKKPIRISLARAQGEFAIRHWQCLEHSLQAETAAILGTEPATFRLRGSVWLAAKTPEQADMETLGKAADQPNYLLGLPSMAGIPADQAEVVGEVLRQLVGKGMLCALDLEARYAGSGRMAELAGKMATRLTVFYTDFSVQAIADESFTIPAGYRVTRK